MSTPHISRCLSKADLEEEHILNSMFPQTSSRTWSPGLGFLLLKVPLIVVLVSTIVAACWVTVWIFHMNNHRGGNHPSTPNNRIVYPCENSRLTLGRDDCLFVMLTYLVVIFLTLPAGTSQSLASCINVLNLRTGSPGYHYHQHP